eukprot:c12173_g1_i2.p1 GENE.c12173_g1_i2~~c12173_g1_i2.p1  ORF type:complete len:179 (+),score=64.92 c12173_g1_i2:62-538(+)
MKNIISYCFLVGLITPVSAATFGGREVGVTILSIFTAVLLVLTIFLRASRARKFQLEKRHDVKQLEAPIEGVPNKRQVQPQKKVDKKKDKKAAPKQGAQPHPHGYRGSIFEAKRGSIDVAKRASMGIAKGYLELQNQVTDLKSPQTQNENHSPKHSSL